MTRIAASYDGTGLDVAPLVLEDRRERLLIALYNLADQARDIGVRVWELKAGEYRLCIGPDADGDDRIDRPTAAREMTIRRHTRVALSVPPRELTLVELDLIEPHDLPEYLPDPALSPRTTGYDPDRQELQVTVHNIGSEVARDVRVVVEGAQGQTLASKVIDAIEAPLDLKPRRSTVSFEVYDAVATHLGIARPVIAEFRAIPYLAPTNSANSSSNLWVWESGS